MEFYKTPLVVELEVESVDILEFDLDVEVDDSNVIELDLDIEVSIVAGSSAEIYDGSYLVTPLAHDEVVLPTTGKLMIGDVTVEKVPYYETSNESGGYTVYIGE